MFSPLFLIRIFHRLKYFSKGHRAIVFLGPDGAGKSTITEPILKLRWPTIRRQFMGPARYIEMRRLFVVVLKYFDIYRQKYPRNSFIGTVARGGWQIVYYLDLLNRLYRHMWFWCSGGVAVFDRYACDMFFRKPAAWNEFFFIKLFPKPRYVFLVILNMYSNFTMAYEAPFSTPPALVEVIIQNIESVEKTQDTLAFLNKDIILCSPKDNLQECVNKGAGKIIILLPGVHKSYVTNIPSHTTLYITRQAIVKLADDAVVPHKGGYVIGSQGTEEKPNRNVKIILNGVVDGNKKIHPYEKSGNEGINFKWVTNSSITGNGVVKNCSGDGIDVDASTNSYFQGIKLVDNDGSGFHFGSPRPIRGSKGNLVVAIISEGNGFKLMRNGLDLSWANPEGAIFVGCISKNNYRNWQISSVGGQVISSFSINTGKVKEADEFSGAMFAQINGNNVTNMDFISEKTWILIKRDIKKILGMKTNKMLDGIKYK